MVRVAALYIDQRGPYPTLEGVDCWDEKRDARRYTGPWPVVAHPPCARWSAFARLNEKRYGQKVGDDGGCFAAALVAVRRFGGVLEHPAGSLAWERFGLPAPGERDAWGQTIELRQCEWGHRAQKRTLLYYTGPDFALEAVPYPGREATHQVGWFDRIKPTLSKAEALHSPREFAQYLVRLARACVDARTVGHAARLALIMRTCQN